MRVSFHLDRVEKLLSSFRSEIEQLPSESVEKTFTYGEKLSVHEVHMEFITHYGLLGVILRGRNRKLLNSAS